MRDSSFTSRYPEVPNSDLERMSVNCMVKCNLFYFIAVFQSHIFRFKVPMGVKLNTELLLSVSGWQWGCERQLLISISRTFCWFARNIQVCFIGCFCTYSTYLADGQEILACCSFLHLETLVFSSPEHEVLRVSYCDSAVSVVRRVLCGIKFLPCVCSRGHIFSPIIMKLGQNVCLHEILDELENG